MPPGPYLSGQIVWPGRDNDGVVLRRLPTPAGRLYASRVLGVGQVLGVYQRKGQQGVDLPPRLVRAVRQAAVQDRVVMATVTAALVPGLR